MTIIVTGSNGQVGSAIKNDADVIGIDQESADLTQDITEDDVIEEIESHNPSAIIHTAAYTSVDGAEENPERARQVNVEGTRHIAKAAERTNAHLVYISTDYVFDGVKGNYSESDKTNPVNVYGATKLEGEYIANSLDAPTTILRTSVVFDGAHQNFFTWAISELQQNDEVDAVTDQIASPTYAPNLAEICIEAVKENRTGIYHAAGPDQISRYDALIQVKEVLDISGTIKPINMNDLSWTAKRPKDSSLDISKLVHEFDTKPISISEAFQRIRL